MARFGVALTVAAMFVASASVVDAQRGGRGGGGGGQQGGATGGGARFDAVVNLPAPPIPSSAGLSISRPIGTQITGVRTNPPPGFETYGRSPFDARRGTYTRLHRLPIYGAPFGYGDYSVGYGPSYAPESTYEKMFRRQAPEMTTGMLFVDATPASALVFVDSAYVGSVGDLQTRGVALSRGRHWLDLEAPGYDKKTIEINITAGQSLRYGVELTPTRRAEAVLIPARPPQTMYAIPGCYGGNRPPVASALPKGCDIAKVRVIRPGPRTN